MFEIHKSPPPLAKSNKGHFLNINRNLRIVRQSRQH